MINDVDRKDLLARLSAVEKLVRADLLAQYRADSTLMARAMKRLREEESAPGDAKAWLETFAGRAAVLYLLKTLYVRVLEDQGLRSMRSGGSSSPRITATRRTATPISKRRSRTHASPS